MAITYVTNYTSLASGSSVSLSSGSLSVAVNDVILVLYASEDNANSGTLSISKSAGTSTVSAFTNIATTNTNGECKVAGWYCTVTGAGTFTVTCTNQVQNVAKKLATIVHTGADTTTPCPAGNRFSGIDTNGDTTQAITPTNANGSALWMIAADWNATNTYAAAANCTLDSTTHAAGSFTATVIRPTTQPRTNGSAFTIGESDTGATNAWLACEIAAAASGVTASTTFTTSAPTVAASTTLTANAVAAITTVNPTAALVASPRTQAAITAATVNPSVAIATSLQSSASITATTVNPTIAASLSPQANSAVAITTVNPTIAGNVADVGVFSASVAITTASPTVAANVSPLSTVTASVTTINPVIAASLAPLTSASGALTTVSPSVAISTSLQSTAALSLTTTAPGIAAALSPQTNAAASVATTNPTVAAAVIEAGVFSTSIAITTVNPSVAVDTSVQSTAAASVTTVSPGIAIDAVEQQQITAEALLTTENPIVAARVTGGEPDYIIGGVPNQGAVRRRKKLWETEEDYQAEYNEKIEADNPLVTLDKSITQNIPKAAKNPAKISQDLQDIDDIKLIVHYIRARNEAIIKAFLN